MENIFGWNDLIFQYLEFLHVKIFLTISMSRSSGLNVSLLMVRCILGQFLKSENCNLSENLITKFEMAKFNETTDVTFSNRVSL